MAMLNNQMVIIDVYRSYIYIYTPIYDYIYYIILDIDDIWQDI